MATLYENYITGDDYSNAIWASYPKGQTFTPSIAHVVTSVKLKLFRTGDIGTVTVSIRATSGGVPTGADLASGTIASATITTVSPGLWYEITLGAGATLSAGILYAIVIKVPGGNGVDKFLEHRSNNSTNGYASGTQVYVFNGGDDTNPANWSTGPSYDAMFEEWGDPPVVGDPGFIWIEGTGLHYSDAAGAERSFVGTDTTNNGIPGFIWVEGTELHYIDQNGDERRQEGTAEGATGAVAGHLWVEGTKLRYIDGSGDERSI